jgi:uncharacterized protein (DUF2147 family)
MKQGWRWFTFLVFAAAVAVTLVPKAASAESWWNRMQDMYHMPETVDRMHDATIRGRGEEVRGDRATALRGK